MTEGTRFDPQDFHPWTIADQRVFFNFVHAIGRDLLQLLAPRKGERVLDLGCRDGYLTEAIANLGADVLGLEWGEEMVAATRLRGLAAEVGRGDRLSFENEFDAVFSIAALHWLPDGEAVARGVYRALVPGGRFVAEMAAAGDMARLRECLRTTAQAHGVDPAGLPRFHQPTVAGQAAILEAAGFTVRLLQLFDRPVRLPVDLLEWLESLSIPYFASLEKAEREAAMRGVKAEMEPIMRDSNGQWMCEFVRLHFVAEKPQGDDLPSIEDKLRFSDPALLGLT